MGSVRFGLVDTPDIDLDVCADTLHRADSFQLMSEIATADAVEKITFKNERFSQGKWLYWEISYRAPDDVLWTIEIYYTCSRDPYFRWPEKFAQAMKKCLTNEHRIAILSIKRALARRNLQGETKSFDIYRAVLGDGVRSPAAFLKWLQSNRTQGISPWVPGLSEPTRKGQGFLQTDK